MSTTAAGSNNPKIYVLDVFKEIESLIKCQSDGLSEKIEDPKIISVINSAGSELKSYLAEIIGRLELKVLNLKIIDIIKSDNKLNKNLTSEVKDMVQNFIEGIKESTEQNLQNRTDEQNSDSEILEFQTKQDIEPLKSKIIIFDCEDILENNEMRIIDEFINEFIKIIKKDGNVTHSTPILVLIFNNVVRIPREIVTKTDLTFIIPYLSNIQRLDVLEELLFGLNIHTVDISKLARLTDGWNTLDLKKLIKVAHLKWKILSNLEREKQNSEIKNESKEDSSNLSKPVEFEVRNTSDSILSKENQSNNNKHGLIPTNEGKFEDGVQNKIRPDLLKFKKLHPLPFTIEIFENIIENKVIIPLKMSPTFGLLDFMKGEIINDNTLLNTRYTFNLGANDVINPEESSLSLKNKEMISGNRERDNFKENFKQNSVFQRGINVTEISSFSTNQLYQFAASTRFEELIIVLQKLSDGKILDNLDRNVLSDFPFVLKDDPKRSIVKLTNAKNRIDRIKKISSRLT